MTGDNEIILRTIKAIRVVTEKTDPLKINYVSFSNFQLF